MKYFYLRRKTDGMFFDGRYMKVSWSPRPRMFRSISGLKNALDLGPEALNPQWWKDYCEKNPQPVGKFDITGRITNEFFHWLTTMHGDWEKFRKENKGMSFISDNFEVLSLEIGGEIL